MKKFMERAKAWLTGHSGMAFYATVLLVAVLVSLNAVVYALTTQYNLYLYSPNREDAAVSATSDLYLARAMTGGRRVTVTFCDDEEDVKKHDTGSFVYATAKAMAEKHPDFITLRFVNAITGYDAEGNFVDLSVYTDGGTRPVNTTSVIFECEGNYRLLSGSRTGYEDFFTLTASGSVYAYTGEEVLAAMICWVTESEHKTVYFTQNHGETADISLNAALVCAGFFVETVNLRKDAVPDDAAMVVISNPVADFEKSADGSSATAELDRLARYLEKGGNLYVAIDPYAKRLHNLEGFLAERGFEIATVKKDDGTEMREIVRDDVNGIPPDGYSFLLTPADNEYATPVFEMMEKYVDGRVFVSNTSHLRLSNGAVPLLSSSAASVAASGGEQVSSDGSYTVVGYNRLTFEDGGTAQIVVTPTVYLTATDAMVNNSYTNKAFLLSLLNVHFDSTSAPIGAHAVMYDSTLLEDFTLGRARLYTALILAIPAALAVTGTVIIIRRKNR